MATRSFKGPSMESDFILNTDAARKELERFKKEAQEPIKATIKVDTPDLKKLQESIQRSKIEAMQLSNEIQKAINAGDKKGATTFDKLLGSKLRQIERYETSFVQLQDKINAEVKKVEKKAMQASSAKTTAVTDASTTGNVPTISKEMQKEIDTLKQQKKEIESILDAINGKDALVKTTKRNDASILQDLITQYKSSLKEYNSEEFQTNSTLEERNKKYAETIRLAKQLSDLVRNINNNPDQYSEKAYKLASQNADAKSVENGFLKNAYNDKKKIASIRSMYQDMISETDIKLFSAEKIGSISSVLDSEVAKTKEGLSLILDTWIQFNEKANSLKINAPGTNVLLDSIDNLQDKILGLASSSTQIDTIESMLANLIDEPETKNNVLNELCNILSIEIPKSAENAKQALDSVTSSKSTLVSKDVEALSSRIQEIKKLSSDSGKEFSFTVDKNGINSYIESAEGVVKASDEASVAVQSLSQNLTILGHTHPDGNGLFSVADIISTIEQKLSGINMPTVALGDKIASVLNLDGVSADVLSQVKDKLGGLDDNAPVSPKMFAEIKDIFAAGGSPNALQTISIANGFNELSEALMKISANAKEAQDPLDKLKNLITYYSGKKLTAANMDSFSTYWDAFSSGAKNALEVFNEVMSQLNAKTLENQDFKIDTNKAVGTGETKTTQIEKQADATKKLTDATKQAADAQKELNQASQSKNVTPENIADVQKINQRIGELQKIISNQNDWVKYLGDALNPDKFKTSGKKEATDQLRDLTNRLIIARKENYESLSWRQYAEEILELSHARAYQEAERQNIASSNLTRYYSDAESNYERNLKTLQEAYDWHQKTLESSQAELGVLQQKLNLTKQITDTGKQTETNKPTAQSIYDGATESVKKMIDQLMIAEQKIYTFKDKTKGIKLDNFFNFEPNDFHKAYILAAYDEIKRVQQEIANMPIVETEDDKKRLIELKEEALRLANTLGQIHMPDSTPAAYKRAYGVSDEDAFKLKTQDFGIKNPDELLDGYRSEYSRIFNEIASIDDNITKHMVSNTDEWVQFRKEKLKELYADQVNYQKLLDEKLTIAANDSIKKQQDAGALKVQRNNLVKDFKASFIDFGKAFRAFSSSQDDAFEDVLAGIKNGTITTVDACIQKFEELSKINFSDFVKKNVFPYTEQPSGQLSLFEGVTESANRASESVDHLKNKVQEVYTVPGQLNLFDAGAQGSIEQLGTAAANALNNSVKDTNIDDVINQVGNAADENKQKIESFGNAAQNALSVVSRSDVSKVLGSSAGKQLGDLGASQTASSVDIAAEAIRSEGAAAEQAAIQKRRFADANKEVAASGRTTAKSINEAAKAVGAEGQSVERAKAYYDELYRLMNNINAKDSEILKLSGKNSDGLYTDYINDLQTQKAEMIARVREIGEQVSMEFGNSIQGAKTYSLSGARFFDEQDTANINAFLNSVQAQSVLTAQDIDKLSNSFQNSKKVGIEFANQISASMAEVNKISGNIFNIDDKTGAISAKGNVNENIQMFQNAKIAYEQLRIAMASLSNRQQADWTAEEARGIQLLIEQFKQYGNVLDQTIQKERQYFSGKTKFEAGTSDKPGTSMDALTKEAEAKAKKATEVQKRLEEVARQFASNSNFEKVAITGFTQNADGIFSLDFSAFEKGTGIMHTFRAEMGQTSEDVFVSANKIKSSLSGINDANKQLMSMNKLKSTLDASGINTDISTATGPLKEFLQNWQLLQNAINNPNTTNSGFAKITKDAKLSSAEVEKLYKQMINMQNTIDRGDAMSLGKIDPTKGNVYGQMINSVQQFAATQDAASVSFGKFNEKAGTLEFTLNKANGATESFKASMASLNGQMMAQSTGVGKLNSEWNRFGGIVAKAGKQLLTALVGYNMMYKAIAEVRKGIGYVKEIDLALTELKKVTNETDATYKEFLNTASRTSAEIGSTVSAFTEATSNFARLGYTIEESTAMAESAVVYKNVADGLDTVEESTEAIISTMKAFGIASDDTMHIVDMFNEVGNNFAITSAGIGEAFKRSASALAAGNNTIEESIGLVTAANSVIQNPEQVGTALKTLSLRIRGVKTELEEAGLETEGMADTTATLQKKLLALTHGKVDILIDEDTFKSTTQILREMSEVWDEMTDMEQAAALELIGGKRQAKYCPNVQKCA